MENCYLCSTVLTELNHKEDKEICHNCEQNMRKTNTVKQRRNFERRRQYAKTTQN